MERLLILAKASGEIGQHNFIQVLFLDCSQYLLSIFSAFAEGNQDFKLDSLKLPNAFANEASSLISNSEDLSNMRRVKSEGVLVKKLSIKVEKQLQGARRRLKTDTDEKKTRRRSPSMKRLGEKINKVSNKIQSSFRSFVDFKL